MTRDNKQCLLYLRGFQFSQSKSCRNADCVLEKVRKAKSPTQQITPPPVVQPVTQKQEITPLPTTTTSQILATASKDPNVMSECYNLWFRLCGLDG